jgi:hypothetical protein
MSEGILSAEVASAAIFIEYEFKARIVPLLDFDKLVNRMLDFRSAQGWWNFRFDIAGLKEALLNGNYVLEGTVQTLSLSSRKDLARMENIALNLLQRMVRSAYRRREAQLTEYQLKPLDLNSDVLLSEIEIRDMI